MEEQHWWGVFQLLGSSNGIEFAARRGGSCLMQSLKTSIAVDTLGKLQRTSVVREAA